MILRCAIQERSSHHSLSEPVTILHVTGRASHDAVQTATSEAPYNLALPISNKTPVLTDPSGNIKTCTQFSHYPVPITKSTSQHFAFICRLPNTLPASQLARRLSKSKQTRWPLVQKRTIPTERPPLVGEF
jgi:hypothetical protein